MSFDSDWDDDFKQPAIKAWYALKKFFDRYHVHINITEAFDPADGSAGDQIGMRIDITYHDTSCVLVDPLADDEYAEYYTIGHWVGKDKWLAKMTPIGTIVPSKIRKLLKLLSKILDEDDQIEVASHTICVHGVPMVSLPQGLDAQSFKTEEPLTRLLQ